MIRKVLVLCVSLIFTVVGFANANGYTGTETIDSDDCLEYFEKGKVLHKYAPEWGEAALKLKVAFVYDEEVFQILYDADKTTFGEKTYIFGFSCFKFTE